VLSNPDKRSQYDRFGSNFQNQAAGQGQQNPGAGFGGFDFSQGFGGFSGGVEFEDAFDMFSDIFGGGQTTTRRARRERGVDLEMEIYLTFDEAVFGVEKELTLNKTDAC
jgi:molecular chaperone DnaJ